MTEIYHFLRLLFVKIGTQYCPDCDVPIRPQTLDAIFAAILRDYREDEIQILAPLIVARKGYYTELAKWAAKKGYSHLRVDGRMVSTDPWPRLDRFKDHDIQLPVGTLKVSPNKEPEMRMRIEQAIDFGKGSVHVAVNGGDRQADTLFSTERACPSCGRSFEEPDPRLFSYNSKRGWCERCYGTGVLLEGFDEEHTGEETGWGNRFEAEARECPACNGQRLKPEALAVRFRDWSIAKLNAMSVDEAARVFRSIELAGREAEIARDLLPEIDARLAFLKEVGLAYLTLNRAAPTLSGGEAQRIRLAAQLGSNLRGVCYILDEPTIGLHPRDNGMLLDTLQRLGHKGNTVVVVEHDEETIRRAEHVVDLGPGAGIDGGEVIAQGTVARLAKNRHSSTGRFLSHPLRHPLVQRRPMDVEDAAKIRIFGARLNNLKDLDLEMPLNRLICVTGVSGSGKSTLSREVLHDNLRNLIGKRGRKPKSLFGCDAIQGIEHIDRVLEVDQTPIGKTPRSCPATYVGIFDHIRALFATTAEARLRGYAASRFSFNTREGRCEMCDGQGVQKIEMSFLPDVEVTCESCAGTRYTADTLAVEFRCKTIADVLAMSVDEAVTFFAAHARVHHALELLQDVGLGYLTLGQRSPTLSGGEAQRIKLVTELAKAKPMPTGRTQAKPGGTLYLLDEPTVGLHMADVEKLIRVLHRLVEAGNSVIVIEHNLDVIAEADWIIDLGPEGGTSGGEIVAQATPEQLVATENGSHTARYLRRFLRERGTRVAQPRRQPG